jgi:murein L,D-transpeptidase YcbB/YkuD
MKKFLVSCVSAIVLVGFVTPADADIFFKRRRSNFLERLLGIDNNNSVETYETPNRGSYSRRKKAAPQWWQNADQNSDTLYGGEPSYSKRKFRSKKRVAAAHVVKRVPQGAYIDPEVSAGIGMGNLVYLPPVVVPVIDPTFSKLNFLGDENNAIRLALSDRGSQIRAIDPIRKAVLDYYKASNFKPLWTSRGKLTERAGLLLSTLSKADAEGLMASRYVPKPLTDFADPNGQIEGDSLAAAQLDVGLTVVALTYAQHISGGAFEPALLSGYNDLKPLRADPVATLNVLSWISLPDKYMAGLAPKHAAYGIFKDELVKLSSGEDAQVQFPDGPRVKVGKTDARVPQLRDILVSMNYLSEADAIVDALKEDVLDKKLSKALKSFQQAKGISQTGNLDGATVKALSGPDKGQMRETLITNMERLRWLPKDLGARHVFVNQAAFRVDVMDNNKPIWTSRVIVGKPLTQTAVFSDKLETVVFNPSWGLPQSILLNEYLPKLRRDPSYLDKIGFKVINSEDKLVKSRSVNWYSVGSDTKIGVQQPPGGDNALGELKFLFPNAHSIYMHDTPTRKLFSNAHRAFSHGCVRVQNPREFAQVLLGWNSDKVKKQLAIGAESGESTNVDLKIKVPVHLTYFTAWPDETGRINYFSDFYERDKAMRQARNIVGTGKRPLTAEKVVDSRKLPVAQVLQ